MEMYTENGNFKKWIKIILSDYWDEIDGWNNYEKIERELNQNPNFKTYDIGLILEYRPWMKTFYRDYKDPNINNTIRYLIKVNPFPTERSVYQSCKSYSVYNEDVWRTLLFLYKNDKVQFRKRRILKYQKKLELKKRDTLGNTS